MGYDCDLSSVVSENRTRLPIPSRHLGSIRDDGGREMGQRVWRTSLPRFLVGSTQCCRALSLVVVLACPAGVWAADGAVPEAIVSLSLAPRSIEFSGLQRRQQLLVTAKTASGDVVDVTHDCRYGISDPLIAGLDGSVLVAAQRGSAQVTARYAGHTVRGTVRVGQVRTFPRIDFETHVAPLFSKLGCNSGGCHGKALGRKGFKLSVFGSEPDVDYRSLVSESRGRRLFPGAPGQSLLIRKAVGEVAHGGGQRTHRGSLDCELLTEWIRQGMTRRAPFSASLTAIRVEPSERILSPQSEQQILVTAEYADGSHRDVTHAAGYSSNLAEIAEVDESGRIRVGEVSGEAAITVNYMGYVSAVRVLIPRSRGADTISPPALNSEIDRLVWEKLDKMGLRASPVCDDATYLRRVFVDTIGTVPSVSVVRGFLADQRPDKRQRLIERVLQRPEFADYWALRWADVLLVDRQALGERGALEFHQWLRRQIADNRPYDQWVRELLISTGNTGKYGPVNFYRSVRSPVDLTRSVSQAFLGIRMDCAQCHHHPFEIWSQSDFYGMAGFFNGLERRKLSADRELIFHAGYRATRLPQTETVVPLKAPGGAVLSPPEGDPREELARWMTASDNPYFARLIANRLWGHFLGRGLVEPVDDLRSTNPASNEPLLRHLTGLVVRHEFDLQRVMRSILESRVYALSSVANDGNLGDSQNYSHRIVRRLPAEVLLDAICQATGCPEVFAGLPQGTRAIQVWDNRYPSYFLDAFGRPERSTPCECGRSDEPTMSQALHLMNAPEIEAKLAADDGRIAQRLKQGVSREALIEELCLATLGRAPGAREIRIAQTLFDKTEDPRAASQDFLWALLNSYEFLFVH